MTSRRLLKAAEAVREVVSMAILTEIRDPRVQHVTVTGVEVAPDMRSAKVLISVMAEEGKQHLCLKGLQNSSGFLQSQLAKKIDTRYVPRLTFELDTGVKKSLEVAKILQELAQERAAREKAAQELADSTPVDSEPVDSEPVDSEQPAASDSVSVDDGPPPPASPNENAN